MCGRYAFYEPWDEFLQTYQIEASHIDQPAPVYNAAPSMNLPVVYHKEGSRQAGVFRWGLIPHWSKDEKIGYKMINARGETVANKPAFRKPFASQRCLVPASGFFEWRRIGKDKQPCFIHFSDRTPMFFAGLYDEWVSKEDGEMLTTYTIITTEANSKMAELHDRMPAILPPEQFDTWLDPEDSNKEQLQQMLQPWPEDTITYYPVSKAVGNPRNQSPDLIERSYGDLFG